ncbi:unnamed protein product [Soboliphyme baturini]|uniref:Thioredoxin-related transmembrane protein 1 n=1 Tax=Soboliphyme baturini TaxID=241478 RepID=A0A3P8HZQ1_9BILA|nr:unnamed protein product [Soboliphyme baturini]
MSTLFSVKDGVFRQYVGPRDKQDFIHFIQDKKWTVVEPVSAWKYPDSVQMSVVAWFFRLSMAVRDFHNLLTEKHGVPSWASYAMFGMVTLILGCILGFVNKLKTEDDNEEEMDCEGEAKDEDSESNRKIKVTRNTNMTITTGPKDML